jgi:hypothetical protein
MFIYKSILAAYRNDKAIGKQLNEQEAITPLQEEKQPELPQKRKPMVFNSDGKGIVI